MEIAVDEAAARLGVSEPRVRQLLASGRLAGRRLGRMWLVDSDDVARLEQQPRLPGRPLGPRRAWGLLDLLDGGGAEWLSASARSQLRASMKRYVGATTDQWRAALAGRSHSVKCQIHPAALARLRESDAARPSGGAIAARRGFDLVADVAAIEQVYVDPQRWGRLSQSLAIRPLGESASGPANLVVLLPKISWPFAEHTEVPDPVLAADLLESPEPRVARAGAVRLNELLERVRP